MLSPQADQVAPLSAEYSIADVVFSSYVVVGAEYSGNNGASWQSSNIFSGLAPETSFIVLVRMAETPNYLAPAAWRVLRR